VIEGEDARRAGTVLLNRWSYEDANVGTQEKII